MTWKSWAVLPGHLGYDFIGAQVCVATARRTGLRCRNPAIDGGVVCMFHGGKDPAVQAEAARTADSVRAYLLEHHIPTVLHELNAIMTDILATDGDKLRAIDIVLRNAGVTPSPHTAVAVQVNTESPLRSLATRLLGDGGVPVLEGEVVEVPASATGPGWDLI